MTDSDNGGGGDAGRVPAGAAGGGEPPQAGPSINVLGQYIKDLSFENPRAPDSFNTQRTQGPAINVGVNVSARPVGEAIEVELRIDARAGEESAVIFNVELVYAGMFRIQNVPSEQLHPFVLIECPRLLFPFARQIVAEVISSGGFPPLMLEPIDFVALYRQRAAQSQGAGAGQPAPPTQQA
jgi:preprotein translocase subunit SecB